MKYIERGGKKGRIGYGEDAWCPDFWLNDVFPWSSMNCNFNNFKMSAYTGPQNFTWFMKKVIKRRLEMKGINVDEYVVSTLNEEEMLMRAKRLVSIQEHQ